MFIYYELDMMKHVYIIFSQRKV